MKYTTTVLIALVALVSTPTVRAAAPDAKGIVSMQAKEFALPDALEMVKIPAGKFVMGSPKDEVGRREDESQRTITISKPFYMAKQEITLNQYVPIMRPGYDPLFFRKGSWGFSLPEIHQNGPYSPGPRMADTRDLTDKPMDGVSWKYAVEFCKKLTAREKAAGRLPAGYEYRLPTEAEWEYACRAGAQTAFSFGHQITPEQVSDQTHDLSMCDGLTPGLLQTHNWGINFFLFLSRIFMHLLAK